MKKTIIMSFFAAVAAIGTVNTANAQKGFYIGIQGAQNVSAMFNKDDADNDKFDYKATNAETFGVSGGYNFNKHMGVAAEAMYSIEGQRFELNNVEFTKRLSYIKIPVLFTYNTNPEAKVMLTAKAGPQLGILMDAKLKDGNHDVLIDDTKDNYKSITFGAMAGVGARVNLAKNLFLDAGLRFDGNFANIEEDQPVAVEGSTTRANTYNFNAGVEVGVKYFFN